MATLPSGIVAFLMTDIEASTQGWNTSPHAMEVAMSALDTALTAIVDAHGGSLVKARGEGDSHFAVFALASHAVAAAAALQRRADDGLSIRACVLIGEACPRGEDYVGVVINHGARIRSIAHGGQVIATRSVVEVTSIQLPGDLSFRALGAHRVRDIPEPIEVFQLCGEGLQDSFPPLRTTAFTASAMMAVVVVDEVASSRRFDESDERVIAWQRGLLQSLRELCDHHDGRYLKLVGDGCIVSFDNPRAALAFADDVRGRGPFRVGIAVGLVEVVEGELVGRPVFDAHVLMRAAGPGEARCCSVTEAICSHAD